MHRPPAKGGSSTASVENQRPRGKISTTRTQSVPAKASPQVVKPLHTDTGRYGADKALLQDAGRIGTVIIKAVPIINRLTLSVLLCVFTASTWGQDLTVAPSRPLDLSVPSGTLTRTWGSPTGADAARLPALGEQPGRPGAAGGPGGGGRSGGHRGDLPYGTGYEARHGQGGGGGGGWRGMGRGR